MDEDQPKKKITLNNFFEQIVEIDKVANAALSNSNNLQSQLNAIQLDLARLIQSLQVNFDSGVQNVQTQINEVTNVIVDDQRMKRDEIEAKQEQVFAEEDRLQKQKPRDLLMGPFDPSRVDTEQIAGDVDKESKGNLPIIPALALGGALANLTGGAIEKSATSLDDNLNSTKNKNKNTPGSAFKNNNGVTYVNPNPSDNTRGSTFEYNKTNNNFFKNSLIDGLQTIKGIIDLPADLLKSTTGIDLKKPLLPNFRSEGGDVVEGKPYVVGEKGLELFIPKGDGTIIPNIIMRTVFERLTGGEKGRTEAVKSINREIDKMTESLPKAVNKFSDFLESGKIESGINKLSDILEVGETESGAKVFKNLLPELKNKFDYKELSGNSQIGDSVINLPPEIIEGSNQVVNEESSRRRGDVVAGPDPVKSPDSPLLVINISESNSKQSLNLMYM